MSENDVRDHLFISYANEDGVLAEWLARKLTVQGYRVWCDRFKLLGGESYPRDIDAAIKVDTFRVLALLSRNSLAKPNPSKERTLALNLARERKEDFLIPLNVDGLSATDLDWMTSDLIFVPFYENWGRGLAQLLKKLESITTPCSLQNGAQIAAETFVKDSAISHSRESLFSNQFSFQEIPEVIHQFRFSRRVEREERFSILNHWPVFFVDEMNAFAFRSPKKLPRGLTVVSRGGSAWRFVDRLHGIRTTNVLVSLLKKEFVTYCISKGLSTLRNNEVFFPANFRDGKLHFIGWDGKKTWLQVVGQRSAWRSGKPRFEYRYHLSIRISIVQQFEEHYVLQTRLGLYITDTDGQSLSARSSQARRKAISRSWWNDAWLNRTLAVCQFLSEGKEIIQMGLPGEEIVLASQPLRYDIPISIDEDALGPIGEQSESLDTIEEEDELPIDGHKNK